jgi:thioredoxin-like negative regulator of GroEL
MIYYFKGEAQRRRGRHAEALAAYETVLAAYPYNEWPDAAICGAAECFVAFGDAGSAVKKLKEVADAPQDAGVSEQWRQHAATRIKELQNKISGNPEEKTE